jgi:hypothetical protein
MFALLIEKRGEDARLRARPALAYGGRPTAVPINAPVRCRMLAGATARF